jgi:hypothetical protein
MNVGKFILGFVLPIPPGRPLSKVRPVAILVPLGTGCSRLSFKLTPALPLAKFPVVEIGTRKESHDLEGDGMHLRAGTERPGVQRL